MLDSLRSHTGSVIHRRAADAIQIGAGPREAVILQELRQLNKVVASKVEKLFTIAYILRCKNGDAIYNLSSSLSTRRKACS